MFSTLPSVLTCFMLCFCCHTGQSHTTACNHGNDDTCLNGNATYAGLRDTFENDVYYWFGRPNCNASCPENLRKTVECQNPAPSFHSIITRMRMSDDNDTSVMTQLLNVHYGVPEGSYKACGSRVQVLVTDKQVDPVQTTETDAWALNHRPHVTWEAAQETKYTLAFWDAGWFELQGMWINIDGGRLEDGEEVMPYRGPMNPLPRKNPVVFLLFRQTQDLNVVDVFDMIDGLMKKDGVVMMNQVMGQLGLEGPIAASNIQTMVTPFSAEYGRKTHLINHCPYLSTKVMRTYQDRLPWNTTNVELKMSMVIRYESAELEFESCCKQHKMPRKMFEVDPRASQPMMPVYTRSKPRVTIIPTHLRDPLFFAHPNRRYTLLFVDLTDSNVTVTDRAEVLWQVINIRGPDPQTGDTILEYMGVHVPVMSLRRHYVFMLMEQSAALRREDVEAFRRADCQPQYRCHFEIERFMDHFNLTLVGLNGFTAATDAYSRRQMYTGGHSGKSAACVGVAGFTDPCPTKGMEPCAGVASLPSLLALLLGVVVSLWV